MTEIMKSLSETLGMNPLIIEEKIPVVIEEENELSERKKSDEDFEAVRKNLLILANKGDIALVALFIFSFSSYLPLAF